MTLNNLTRFALCLQQICVYFLLYKVSIRNTYIHIYLLRYNIPFALRRYSASFKYLFFLNVRLSSVNPKLYLPLDLPGVDSMRGSDRILGGELPSPRTVSVMLQKTEQRPQRGLITLMVMQWGQFTDHDIVHTPESALAESGKDGRFCTARRSSFVF